MSDTPLGPGSWRASDGLWYPHEAHPDVHIPGAEPPTAEPPPTMEELHKAAERTPTGVLVNLIVLLVVGGALVIGGGWVVSEYTEDRAREQAELFIDCEAEKDAIQVAEEAAVLLTGQYQAEGALLAEGLLEEEPEYHSIRLVRAADGTVTDYRVVATDDCRR